MIRNLEVTQAVDHYDISEQAGSDYKASRVIHQAESAEAARRWLIGQGAEPSQVEEAFAGFAGSDRVFIEIAVQPASEGFPRQ